jgi:hypothetical protein
MATVVGRRGAVLHLGAVPAGIHGVGKEVEESWAGMMVRRHVEMMLMGWHGVWTYKVMGRKKTMGMVKIGRDLTWLQK